MKTYKTYASGDFYPKVEIFAKPGGDFD